MNQIAVIGRSDLVGDGPDANRDPLPHNPHLQDSDWLGVSSALLQSFQKF
jgi:hypothetical protein